MTSGIVSALDRSGINVEGYDIVYPNRRLDHHGNSGRALVATDVRLVGRCGIGSRGRPILAPTLRLQREVSTPRRCGRADMGEIRLCVRKIRSLNFL
ncbi:hypothetical protein CN134_00760 [Sinorhizobium meliloti]|nr:hypothetical protein CN134_00760 [Sinorhizobium meliloti]RVO36831.1 hypothetical protein CN098_00960 [Sinorhizobium meliloti]